MLVAQKRTIFDSSKISISNISQTIAYIAFYLWHKTMLPRCKLLFTFDLETLLVICCLHEFKQEFYQSKHKLDPPACLPACQSPQFVLQCAAAMPHGQVELTRPNLLAWPSQATMTSTSNQNTGMHTVARRTRGFVFWFGFYFSFCVHIFTVVFHPCTPLAQCYGNYSAFIGAEDYLLGPNARSFSVAQK